MATQIARIADQVVCTEFTNNPRAAVAAEVCETLRNAKPRDRAIEVFRESEPEQALRAAIEAVNLSTEPDATGLCGTVVICGSFFLAGELRPKLVAMTNVVPETIRPEIRSASESSACGPDSPSAAFPEKELL